MKKRLFLALLALMLLVSVLALSSCTDLGGLLPDPNAPDNTPDGPSQPGDNENDKPGDENPGTDDPGNEDPPADEPDPPTDEPDPPADEPDDPVVPTVYYKLTFKDKDSGDVITSFKVAENTLVTAEQKDEIAGIRYHGYGFAGWYTDMQFRNEFDPSIEITSNLTLYGDRGDLCGENIVWSYDFDKDILKISGEGQMFNFEYSDDAPWVMYKTLCKEIIFEGNITAIGYNSFYGFSAISEVKLPKTLTVIGEAAFYQSSVTSINFPDSLLYIEPNAFFRCTNLTRLDFNPGLLNIGKSAFYECTGVVNVVLTDKIAELGSSAFFGDVNIRSAYYVGTKDQYDKIVVRLDNFWVQQLANTYFLAEEKPTSPGPYWFYNDEGNIEQWYYTVGFIAPGARVPFTFDYVDPELGVSQANLDFMAGIVYRGYKFSRWDGSRFGIKKYEVGTKLTEDIRFTGVRGNICGDDMKWSFSGVTLTLTGTGRMWDFEGPKDAPWYGRNVCNVVIGEDIEYIGSYAFSGHTQLISIDIPTNIVEMNANTFNGCNLLKYIYYLGDANQMNSVVGISSLENTLDALVYAKTDLANPGEGRFWLEKSDEQGTKRVAWEFKAGKLTIGGDESLVNYSEESATPWYAFKDSITAVEIREGANRVGAYTFSGDTIVSIVIPDSVLKIAKTAFSGTGYYKDANNWGADGALYISNHLIKVDPAKAGEVFTIANNVISIAEQAFENCSGIKSLVLNKEVCGVYSNALSGLTALENVFYLGPSMEAWNVLWSPSGVNAAAGQTIPATVNVYCYSKTAPSDDGNWWHYVVTDGVSEIVIWE